MSRSELADITVQLHHETDKAWLVSIDGVREGAAWVPKSVGELERTRHGQLWILTMPEYMAREKGLI